MSKCLDAMYKDCCPVVTESEHSTADIEKIADKVVEKLMNAENDKGATEPEETDEVEEDEEEKE